MLNNVYLDVAIGMVFIFLLYSLLTTAIQELFASWLSLRGKYLQRAIMIMLEDTHLGEKLGVDFFDHPLIVKSTFSKLDKVPSYIQPELFSVVLRDILPDLYLGKDKNMTLKEKIKLLPNGELKKILNARSPKNTKEIDRSLEAWFNASMDRLSGTYKRSSQKRVLLIGFLVAAVFNVNSIMLFQKLSTDEEAREKLVIQAVKFAEAHDEYMPILDKYQSNLIMDSTDKAKSSILQDSVASDSLALATDSILEQSIDTLSPKDNYPESDSALFERFKAERKLIGDFITNEISPVNTTVGIGWGTFDGEGLLGKLKKMSFSEILLLIAGWSLTAIAISLGAPFWFDLLQRFIRIRGAGKKPLTEEEKQRFSSGKGVSQA